MRDSLSQGLLHFLPSKDVLARLWEGGRSFVPTHQILTTPYSTLKKAGFQTSRSVLTLPTPDMHPVLLARYILRFVLFVQRLPPEVQAHLGSQTKSPKEVLRHLANIAVHFIQDDESSRGTIESLECTMMEAFYHENSGDVQGCWLAARRALTAAQLMGLHRKENRENPRTIDPATKPDAHILWARILDFDRSLCLFLGLPQGHISDDATVDPIFEKNSTMGVLESVHTSVVMRIIQRNNSQATDDSTHLVRSLDLELQEAANSLPMSFWAPPNLAACSSDPHELFWETRRLNAQMLHYNIINQLHLPLMIPRTDEGWSGSDVDFSRLSCANASREVLSRYVVLHSIGRNVYDCRTNEHLVMVAAVTLLLAHLDSRGLEAKKLLAHQYYTDRAIIDQVCTVVRHVRGDDMDPQSADTVESISKLLDLTHSSSFSINVRASKSTILASEPESEMVSVTLPCYGIIDVTPVRQEASRMDRSYERRIQDPQVTQGHVLATEQALPYLESVELSSNALSASVPPSTSFDAEQHSHNLPYDATSNDASWNTDLQSTMLDPSLYDIGSLSSTDLDSGWSLPEEVDPALFENLSYGQFK